MIHSVAYAMLEPHYTLKAAGLVVIYHLTMQILLFAGMGEGLVYSAKGFLCGKPLGLVDVSFEEVPGRRLNAKDLTAQVPFS